MTVCLAKPLALTASRLSTSEMFPDAAQSTLLASMVSMYGPDQDTADDTVASDRPQAVLTTADSMMKPAGTPTQTKAAAPFVGGWALLMVQLRPGDCTF